MRKPRSDSVLKTLHPERQLQIWKWLSGDPETSEPPLSQKQTVGRIKAVLGFDTSAASLSEFYAWYPFRQELEEAASLKDEITEYLASNPDVDLDAEQVSKVSQIIWEKRAAQSKDSKLFIELRKLRQKDRDQSAVDRRLNLLEEQAAKAKEIAGDEKLTPEERERKIKQFFGVG